MRRAFVVGSNGPEAGRLRFAQEDARRMREALGAKGCGFTVMGGETRWTSTTLRDALYRAAEQCAPDDTFIFYFAGHGKQAARGGLFLLLDDTDPARPLETALLVSHVVEAMRQSRATSKLLILDCCHAGEAIRDSGFRDDDEPYSLKDAVADENFEALMAGDHLDRARELDSLGGGFLTSHIVDALTTRRFDATGGSGVVTLQRLGDWLDIKWQEYQSRRPVVDVPRPMLSGTRRGKFYLTVLPRWKPYALALPEPFGSVTVLPIARPDSGRVYCIGTSPVTNRQYRELLPGRPPSGQRWVAHDEGGAWVDFAPWEDERFNGADQPITCVALRDASDYTQALASRLPPNWRVGIPSPALWTFAAFGTQNPVLRPPTWQAVSEVIIDEHYGKPLPTAAAGEDLPRRTNGLGLVDAIGNVWEWCASSWERDKWGDYSTHFLICDSIDETPERRVKCEIRGGSYLDDLRIATIVLEEQQLQDRRDTRHANVGFRMAVSIRPEDLPADVVERVDECAPIQAT
jgi:Sulfatase-modifying factor enzyme 1/Caspase domain